MAIEGPLSELSVHDVFQLLDLSRKTGILTLTSNRAGESGVVHFDRGQVIGASKKGEDATPRVGNILLRAGKVTEGELRRAREIQLEQPDRRFGEILVEMGSIRPEDLREALRFQIEETVHALLKWEEGYFSFVELEDSPDPGRLVRIRAESLLMESARRVDEWTTIAQKVPDARVIPALAPLDESRGAPVVDLRPEEWEVLAEIDGRRNLTEIATTLGVSEFDVAKTVFGLVTTGIVEVVDAPSRGEVSRAGHELTLTEAHRLLEDGQAARARVLLDELERDAPQVPQVFLLSGRVYMAQRRYRAALEAFSRAVELDPLSAQAQRCLGFAAVHAGDLDRAIEAWMNCLRLSGSAATADARVARVLAAARVLQVELAREEQVLT
ncbi:MAG: DUF4388 domain-containing protein [Gemmatimonadetes bacterium]|nr:DUF4388 domain-containing protein [Gemmatimonadota bacterium]